MVGIESTASSQFLAVITRVVWHERCQAEWELPFFTSIDESWISWLLEWAVGGSVVFEKEKKIERRNQKRYTASFLVNDNKSFFHTT